MSVEGVCMHAIIFSRTPLRDSCEGHNKMPRRSPRFATDWVDDFVVGYIADGPSAGENLALQANGRSALWHFDFQIHLLARRLLIRIQQSQAAQGSDEYDESDANEEDEEDHDGYDEHFYDDYDYDDDDEADDNDMDEEGSVPAGVLEALPRRTCMRVTRQAAPCAICLDEPTTDLILVRLPCRHEFCEPCIIGWLKRKNACPQCRAPIRW